MNTRFWHVTPCILVDSYQRFGGICFLNFNDRLDYCYILKIEAGYQSTWCDILENNCTRYISIGGFKTSTDMVVKRRNSF